MNQKTYFFNIKATFELWKNFFKMNDDNKPKDVKMADNTDVIKDKVDLLTISRFRDRSKVEKAIEVQDRLRKKSSDWDGTEEIRRWREAR